jgi:cephalosporin-C deacetylase-like acetyl esterase
MVTPACQILSVDYSSDYWPMATHFSLQEAVKLLGLDRESSYRNQVLDFIEAQFHQLAAALPRPQRAEEWRQRVADLRPRLLRSLGLAERPDPSPLNAEVTGRIERTDYVVEKVIYTVRPGFPVSVHLYLPRHAQFPAPAVLYSLGHWMENGKLEPDVQRCCANLARLGFVTLVYDMIGQGERLGECPFDHGHLEPLLVGQCQEGLMVWESIRAIDYLVSRAEVEPTRIGMTGSSGGGLNTFYTAAVDERIQVSIPVCYVDTFFSMVNAERDRNWEDGVDLCNQVPGVVAYAEMWDICGLLAPKAQCIIAAQHDWLFPIEGVRQVFQEVARIYTLLGAPERVRLVEVDAPHGYDQTMRETAYGWFARWLQQKGDGSALAEAAIELIPPAFVIAPNHARRRPANSTLSPGLCFPEGHSPPVGPAITTLTQQLATTLPPTPPLPTTLGEWDKERAARLVQLPAVLGPWPAKPSLGGPWVDFARGKRNRLYNRTVFRGLLAERLVFESEPGIELPALFFAPAQWQQRTPVVLYVDEWGKDAGLANGMVEVLLVSQMAVLAVDLRGIGEVAVSDFEATTNALMTDRPFFAQQLWDLLRSVDCLWHGSTVTGRVDTTRIGCVGRGLGGLLALHAAAVDERIAAVVSWQAPVSYHTLVVEHPAWPASAYLFGVLNHYDLPDLMAMVAPRPLLVAEPVNGLREHLSDQEASGHGKRPRQIYSLVDKQPAATTAFTIQTSIRAPAEISQWLSANLGIQPQEP